MRSSNISIAHQEKDRLQAKIAICTNPHELALLEIDLKRLLSYPQLQAEELQIVRSVPRGE